MKTLFLITSLLFASACFAGPGHGHSHGPVDTCKKLATNDLKTSSKNIGMCHVSRLIKAGKIDPSWSGASHVSSETKTFKGNKEWVVTFNNEKGAKGKNLYVFLKLNGGFVAANFTGK